MDDRTSKTLMKRPDSQSETLGFGAVEPDKPEATVGWIYFEVMNEIAQLQRERTSRGGLPAGARAPTEDAALDAGYQYPARRTLETVSLEMRVSATIMTLIESYNEGGEGRMLQEESRCQKKSG